jgi:hypothetical protein
MKRFLVPVLIVNALLLGVRAWQELPVAQGGAGVPATDDRFCADSNGDGILDMSDAVTVLNFLFNGQGSPPYCIAQGTSLDQFATLDDLQALRDELTPRLDVLEGDTTVADLTARVDALSDRILKLEVPCEEPTDRFIDNTDGTITDTCTGLMWQQEKEHNWTIGGCSTSSGQSATCVGFLEQGPIELLGYSDWRVPTLQELRTILNVDDVPMIHDVFFEGGLPNNPIYWTSQLARTAGFANRRVALDFGFGVQQLWGFTAPLRVVRGP